MQPAAVVLHHLCSSKVHQVDFHPTLPWVVAADRADHVVVLDRITGRRVLELSSLEAARVQKMGLLKVASRDPSNWENAQTMVHAAAAAACKAPALSAVSFVQFMDADVCGWQLTQQEGLLQLDATLLRTKVLGSKALVGRRWLLVCCEATLVFVDMLSRKLRHIPKAVFDGKSPTCASLLIPGAVPSLGDALHMAVGCADGGVRILCVASGRVVQHLSGCHKGAVQCLLTLAGLDGGPVLVSGGAEGVVAVWDAQGMDGKETPAPTAAFKAHTDGVGHLTLASGPNDMPMLVTVGGMEAAVWAFGTWTETLRLQPSIRPVACISAAFCPTPCLGRAQVLLCAKGATLWAADLLSSGVVAGATHAALDMTAILEAPKPVKLYCMRVHPLQPGLLAVGTNAGLVLLNLEGPHKPAVAVLVGEHVSAYAAVGLFGSGLHGLHLSPPELSDAPTTTSVPAPFAARGPKLVELPAHPGGATLAASASGRYVSVAWRGCGTERFCIFRCGTGAGSASEHWEEVHTGVGGAVAWAAVTDTFACQLGSGSAAAAVEGVCKGKTKGSRITGMFLGGGGKDATPEATIMAAMEGVVVCEVADGEVRVVERGVGATDGAVRDVFGGALLGVLSQPLQGPKAVGMEGAALAFYTWDGRTCLGSGLSPPLWLEWDPAAAHCALAYPHCVVVYRTSPTRDFEAVGQLDLAIEEGSPTAMMWGSRLMVVATHAAVHVAWVSGDAVVDTFRLAAFSASPALTPFPSTLASVSAMKATATAPPLSRRAPGLIALLPPTAASPAFDESVLALDASLRAHTVSLTHPMIACRCMAAKGALWEATQRAATELPPEQHDAFAYFLSAMPAGSGGPGATHALWLPGLSQRATLDMALQAGEGLERTRYLRRALHTVDCLAAAASSTTAAPSPSERVGSPVKVLAAAVEWENLACPPPPGVPAAAWAAQGSALLRVYERAAALGDEAVAQDAASRLQLAASAGMEYCRCWLPEALVSLGNTGDTSLIRRLCEKWNRATSPNAEVALAEPQHDQHQQLV